MHRSAFLALAGLLLPSAALAQDVQATLSPDVWYVDTEVVIRGTNLQGPMPSKSKVCFAPEADKDALLCFLSTHPNITHWGSSTITFIPPKNTPPIGVVALVHPYAENQCEYLYGDQKCQTVTQKDRYDIGTYKANPFVTQIIDTSTKQPLVRLEVGHTYEAKGYRFGETGYGIYVGRRLLDKTDILVWTHESIRFRITKEPDDPVSVQVHNGAGKSNAWVLEQPASSADDGRRTTRLPASTGSTALTGSITAEPESSASSVSSVVSSVASSGATTAVSGSGAASASSSSSGLPLPEGWIFTDVPPDSPYAPAIDWAKRAGLLSGYPDGSFRPKNPVSRAELLKILFAQEPSLQDTPPPRSGMWDVDPASWYTPFVRYAVARKIVQGYPDGSFRPGQPVNMAEALQILYRSLAVPTLDPQGTQWYSRYLEHAAVHGILFDATVNPALPMSRQDTVWVIWKILQFHEAARTGA